MQPFTVMYAPEALQEIQCAVEYYNNISEKLGNDLN